MDKPPRPRNRRRGPRKRGGGGRGGGEQNQNKPRADSGMQHPQMKITFRNIGDIERHGTVAGVMELLQKLIQQVNDDINTASSSTTNASGKAAAPAALLPIQLDQESVQSLIREEQLVLERIEKEKQKAEATKEEDMVNDDSAEAKDDSPASAEGSTSPKAVGSAAAPALASATESPVADYAAVAKQNDVSKLTGPAIHARVLYVVPPKKSRRRGEKNGCAYLVLTSAPEMTPRPVDGTTATAAVAPNPANNMTHAERSRVAALGRLQLLNTLDALSNRTKLDAKSSQQFAGCVVEQSLSAKTWKNKPHYENRVGTIETTGDYKKFMEHKTKSEEERLARPKPAPGGGVSSGDAVDEDGQPVAALVLHVRAKREREARMKTALKKQNKPKSESRGGSKAAGSQQKKSAKRRESGAGFWSGGKGKKLKKKKGKGSNAETPKRANLTLMSKAGIGTG